jgi:hypothetical protein
MRGKKIRSEGIKTFGETYSISTELHFKRNKEENLIKTTFDY